MKKIIHLITCCFVSLSFAQDVVLESFATGLSNPVNIKHAGDNRLFVVERSGVIKIVNADGTVNPTSFLDIDDRVSNSGGERGLLAVAFHPNYENNGFFYVNYINNSQNTIISRFTRTSLNSADSNSEVILLTIPQPFSNHNGGDMHFGPNDGYLYISTGDGGASGDPGNRAQNLNLLLGKMLRIDVDATDMGNYGIPQDNPFVGNSNALNELWAYGLRNPFKFSFDRVNGDLWIADVGQNQIEEINKVNASSTGGENYGWNCFEGTSTFQNSTACSMITHQLPVEQYTHNSAGGCSITGGYVYRGTTQTTLQGLYIFADFCSDDIGYVEETAPGSYTISFIEDLSGLGISAFGEGFDGELYVASLFQGTIFKLSEDNLSVNELSDSTIMMFPNPAKHSLTINALETTNLISTINIYNVQGKRVLSHAYLNEQRITISTQTLERGLYIVEILDGNDYKSSRKLIVE